MLWTMKSLSYLGCLLVLILAVSILGCEDNDPIRPEKLPVVTIHEPNDNSSFAFNTSVRFYASGWGKEDGVYTPIVWTISSDQDFRYQGMSWTTSNLSIGSHTVTASITDSRGTNTDSVTITITPN